MLHKSEQPVGLKVWAEPGHNGASITPDPDSPGRPDDRRAAGDDPHRGL